MRTIRYTLLSDGSSDKMLMPILDWLLYQHCPEYSVKSAWADLANFRGHLKLYRIRSGKRWISTLVIFCLSTVTPKKSLMRSVIPK